MRRPDGIPPVSNVRISVSQGVVVNANYFGKAERYVRRS